MLSRASSREPIFACSPLAVSTLYTRSVNVPVCVFSADATEAGEGNCVPLLQSTFSAEMSTDGVYTRVFSSPVAVELSVVSEQIGVQIGSHVSSVILEYVTVSSRAHVSVSTTVFTTVAQLTCLFSVVAVREVVATVKPNCSPLVPSFDTTVNPTGVLSSVAIEITVVIKPICLLLTVCVDNSPFQLMYHLVIDLTSPTVTQYSVTFLFATSLSPL